VIGVIGPAAGEAVKLTQTGKIGVIGTRATVRSEAYPRTIQRLNPRVTRLPTWPPGSTSASLMAQTST
jgi:glutamate racemase